MAPNSLPSRSLRVAVIGAGAAGLVAARELLDEGHAPVVVFERAAGVGGTWLYDVPAPDSADPLGTGGVHSSLYASLRTNLPREFMGFLDFPFAGGGGGETGDPRRYPGHAEVLRYLEEFARRFDLHGLVQLRTEVVRVRREASGSSWRVAYSTTKLQAGGSATREESELKEEVFDAVVVCNGHFAEPRVADIAGIDSWPGKQMHSHSYRVPDPFQGQVVVIIGYNPSGIDISRDIAGVAKKVHVAIRPIGPVPPAAPTCETPPPPPCPGHANLWLHHSMIERAEEDGSVVFQDGTRVKADHILHCTGYRYSFPFLCEGDGVVSVEDNRVGPLYKHVFPPQLAPRISFVGLPFKTSLFLLFQLQSKWVAGVLSGTIELPSEEDMMQDVTSFYSDMEARGLPTRYTHDLGYKFEYEDWLAEQCGHAKVEEWRRAMLVASIENAMKNMESYREECKDDHLLAQANQDFTKYSNQFN